MRAFRQWQWHLDEVYVTINGVTHCLWHAVDHERAVLESLVTKTRDRKTVPKFLWKSLKRHGRPDSYVTDRLCSFGRTDGGRWTSVRDRRHALGRAFSAASAAAIIRGPTPLASSETTGSVR